MSDTRLEFASKGLLCIMIYPIMFADNPVAHIERVVELIADAERPKSYPPVDRFVAAIDAGLAGMDNLARLLPQPHAEDVIRRYLAALRVGLVARQSRILPRP
jgi:hypothetical protein